MPGEAVEFVVRQLQVPASELDAHEWSGRTVECHRAQIRGHLGFRESPRRPARPDPAVLVPRPALR
ncbi:hypothetical protein GCM10010269_73540 [Streptomyces humidus]|uniref:DUF4158 domain-containing protein n=1 Tax=Streptomyces humidus TaxID=52259 RepID=A0A918LA56_9ACTN|nr:hypothetical protein GCM10010269_73540 [Streptomyces humidus]